MTLIDTCSEERPALVKDRCTTFGSEDKILILGARKKSRTHRALLFALLCSASARAAPSGESPKSLRVRAQSQITDVSVVLDADHTEIRGRLVDDLDGPIAGADVVVEFPGGGAVLAHGCSAAAAPLRQGEGWAVATDEHGTFCIRSGSLPPSTPVKARYAGDAYHDSVEQPLSLEAQQVRARLSFDAPVVEADLGEPTFSVWCAASAPQAASMEAVLRVVLLHRPAEEPDKPIELGAADVPLGRRARFEIETKRLGRPGTGTLIARHAGSPTTAVAETTAALNRTATVALSLAGDVVPATPGEEFELRLGAASPVGAVPEGWVEAIGDGRPIGIAPVSAGTALLKLKLEAPRATQAAITLRYVPREPWWVAGDPIVINVPVESPAWWTRLPWLIAVAAIAYWITRSWRRPGRLARASATSIALPGRAGVLVVAPGPAGGGIWGTIVDAHDGNPIRDARVRILLPTFTGEGVAATTLSDQRGAFELPPQMRGEGARLEVTAAHHSRLSRDLPGPGQVLISVVSRRRALLERLVSWARTRGRPWAVATDPTPGHIIATAQREQHEGALQWARAVEEAAYGPIVPDERREEEVVSREPGVAHAVEEDR